MTNSNYKGEYMASRTAEGKHVTRFIILKKNGSDEKFVRSLSVPGYFETRELAQAAADESKLQYPSVQYKVRQK
jgi:hypothetical protein